MSAVGLRELKNQLSRYVQQARSGETVLITDRGEVVAELSPPRKRSVTGEALTTLEEMRRKGLLHGGGVNDPSLYPLLGRALKRTSASRLLDDERGDR
jgi:prevent-host-death family protein